MSFTVELIKSLSDDDLKVLLMEASSSTLGTKIATELAERRAAADERSQKQQYVREISELLEGAKQNLIRAGELAAQHGIPFTFVAPNAQEVYHSGRWRDSACYAADGWYSGGYVPPMTVDGGTIPSEVDYNWQSSYTAGC